jgi:hypothetical protein
MHKKLVIFILENFAFIFDAIFQTLPPKAHFFK